MGENGEGTLYDEMGPTDATENSSEVFQSEDLTIPHQLHTLRKGNPNLLL